MNLEHSVPLKCMLAPPLVASKYSCGTSCVAPVTILWLASCAFMLLGFLGGPMGKPDISWATIAVGILMWLMSGCWTWYATRNRESCQPRKTIS